MILPTGWNYGLVAVSIIVAIIGSSVFLDLALRVRSTTVPVMKRVWLILGALIMGLSIWSMHFISFSGLLFIC
jgi:NO-binding membrane sensor protein with MHYT domain